MNLFKSIIKSIFGYDQGEGISILVPFHCPDKTNQRAKNWEWLKRFWEASLPDAEIVMGKDHVAMNDPSIPFSKSVAVNDAASKATGDIFVIVDADGYVDIDSVLIAAKEIRQARRRHRRLWFVPYRHFFRLTKEASQRVLQSSPDDPCQISFPPDEDDIQSCIGSQNSQWYGAMIQICSREAFEEVGGWDPRFRGWGGEDHAAMRAMDTLYWPHKTLPVQILHIWHPFLSEGNAGEWVGWQNRIWAGQTKSALMGLNGKLSGLYYAANGNRKRMRALLDKGLGTV
jgi:hypothetical protein